MQAIILAAGMGKRLGELTQSNTKCMIEVNGKTLIDRMLRQIDERNFERIVIVIGYEGDKLKQYISTLSIRTPIVFINNPVYDKTNNIFSLYLAKDYLTENDTILFESDLIFEDTVLDKLVDDPYPNLALVAKFESWMDGTVLVVDEKDNIKQFVSTQHFKFEDIPRYYKTVNIYKFSKTFSENYYVPFLEAYSKALGNNEYYEQVLRVITLLDGNELKVLKLENEAWYEIDDIQDLDIAESIFAQPDQKLAKMEKRYGGYWRYPALLDFCYLVNPFFPDSKLLAEMKANFERILGQYPSGMQVNSLLAAKNFGIKSDYIVVGNGAAELIKSLMTTIEGKIGVIFPTFEEYPNRIEKERIVSFISSKQDFSYTATDLIDYFYNKEITTLLLVNPDNPTGSYIPYSDIIKLSDWADKKRITLIIDESFCDFANESPENTLIQNQVLDKYENLVVIKSISKSYGVPGLRLGVLASSNTSLVSFIKKDVPIWNINSFAEFYMQIYSKYEKSYLQACKKFKEERTRFYSELQAIKWLRVMPSEANYFLCEVTDKFTSSELTRLLLEDNILIKNCSGKRGFGGEHFIRIAIRSKEDNCKLINALKKYNNENN
ncbi:aminotransferase class I/II-fold pyridoxal phosphate-dependent enzyme [Bacteroidales bacterium OttesenSCG-928-B11]|nr:aminotransferase class I/II-fold pyridoxal phosphate-dependent enzyme [Bacteroidales bacterium OttesenSCG-928-E04]MDL2309146.1 aminotransferase class I/II-fold pyridoxal phosphate-dependent enzyme [Bacteroidales bacterium OttesenSCG-928-C03]MDL2312240.1 aminotransferase class I/II-fold pyridoxal phosphate-dependent enzyme [Bacteroidales bacterium OttesenSCG-928-B11]